MALVINNRLSSLPVVTGEVYGRVKFINIDEDNNICDILYDGRTEYKNCKIEYYKKYNIVDITLADGDWFIYNECNDVMINMNAYNNDK